jgi:hypothetical protein
LVLLPAPEAKVYSPRRHGGSAKAATVLVKPTTHGALVNFPLLRVDDDRVKAVALLSAELLRIRIRNRLRSCGAAPCGRCTSRNQIGAIARVHDRIRRRASCEGYCANHDSNLKPLTSIIPQAPLLLAIIDEGLRNTTMIAASG